MYYVNIFFLFSILGHFIENFFYTTKDSGILYGWWTPIYGIGVVTIIGIYNYIDKKFKLKKGTKFVIVFLIGAIGLALLEFIGGVLIEKIFRVTFWDYSDDPLSIGRYTSLKMSLVWGISSLFVIYILKPIIDKTMNHIPRVISYILITLFMIDCFLTFAPNLIK